MKERTVRAGEEELFKSPRPREGPGQDHRPAPRAARREDRRVQGRAAEPPAQRHPHRRRAGQRARADADRRLLRRGHARVHRRARHSSRAGSRSGSSRSARSRCRRATRSTRSSRGERSSRSSSGATCCCAASASSRARFTRAPAGRPARCGWCRSSSRNYNAVELGPRGTGKSHLFQQISPYAHLVSGGKATIANMFVNNAHRPARARRAVRRRLLRRGVGRLVRPEGGRQHPQGLHGVRRVQPRQGEHPRRRRDRHGRQLRRRRLGRSCAVGHLLRAAAEGDARRHRLHGPHPRVPPGLGRPEARSRPTSPTTSGSSATSSPSAGASCAGPRGSTCPGPAGVGQPAQRPRPQGGEQHRQRAAEAALADPRWRCRTRRSPGRPSLRSRCAGA